MSDMDRSLLLAVLQEEDVPADAVPPRAGLAESLAHCCEEPSALCEISVHPARPPFRGTASSGLLPGGFRGAPARCEASSYVLALLDAAAGTRHILPHVDDLYRCLRPPRVLFRVSAHRLPGLQQLLPFLEDPVFGCRALGG